MRTFQCVEADMNAILTAYAILATIHDPDINANTALRTLCGSGETSKQNVIIWKGQYTMARVLCTRTSAARSRNVRE